MNGCCHGNPLRGGCGDKEGDLVSPTGVHVGGVTGSILTPPPTHTQTRPTRWHKDEKMRSKGANLT